MKNQASTQSSEDDLVQWVAGSSRQRGYRRRRPWTYDLPKQGQRRTRARFGRIAHDFGRGKFGTSDVVDKRGQQKEIPSSAVPVMDKMRGPIISPERIRVISEILARAPSPST